MFRVAVVDLVVGLGLVGFGVWLVVRGVTLFGALIALVLVSVGGSLVLSGVRRFVGGRRGVRVFFVRREFPRERYEVWVEEDEEGGEG